MVGELGPGRHRLYFQHLQHRLATARAPTSETDLRHSSDSSSNKTSDASPGGPSKWDPNSTAFNYTAMLGPIDSTTSGDWVGVYGKKGYVLLNYSNDGLDVVSLPKFIEKVFHPLTRPLTHPLTPPITRLLTHPLKNNKLGQTEPHACSPQNNKIK